MTNNATSGPAKASLMDKLPDTVERVGNKVPHPVLMFAYLIGGVIVLSTVLSLLGVSATEEVAVPSAIEATPDFYEDVSAYTLSGYVDQEVAYEIEERTVAPKMIIAFLIVFVGVLSSVASDAGYLILIPLGAAAFMAVGRHPIAGLAAGFGGVAAGFMLGIPLGPGYPVRL